MPDKNLYFSKTTLTGGGATALDSIDGTGRQTGEFAFVDMAGVLYVYRGNAASAAAENSPLIISPDANAGNFRWGLAASYESARYYQALETRAMDAASGDVDYTGCPFTPTSVEIIALGPVSGGNYWAHSFGSAQGVGTDKCVAGMINGALEAGQSKIVRLVETTGTKEQGAVMKTLNSNGCSLTWTKTGSPAATTARLLFIYRR